MQQLLHWFGIKKTDHIIFFSFHSSSVRQYVVFWNIDAHRIRRLYFLLVHNVLPNHLTLAREIPIDKKLGRVRMRRAIDEHQHAASAAADKTSFFELIRRDLLDRQPLLDRLVDISTEETKRILAGRQPIRSLPTIAEQGDFRLRVEAA